MMFKWYSEKFLALLNREKVFENSVKQNFGKGSAVYYHAYGGDKKIDVRETLRARGLTEDLLRGVLKGIIHKEDDNDTKVEKIRDFVNKHLTYISDQQNYLQMEYWADPWTVYDKAKDDCDGYAILIMKLMELAGVPAWRRRVCTGRIETGEGHAWVVYLTEKNNMWCVVEGSFAAEKAKKEFNKLPFHKNKRYDRLLWFTFNEVDSWVPNGVTFLNKPQ